MLVGCDAATVPVETGALYCAEVGTTLLEETPFIL